MTGFGTQFLYVPACTSDGNRTKLTYHHKQQHGMKWYEICHTGTNKYVLVYTSLYLLHHGLYKYVNKKVKLTLLLGTQSSKGRLHLIWSDVWYILVCTGIYYYVPIYTCMYMDEHSISQTLNIQCFITLDYWMSCTVHGRCVH